MTDKNVTQRIGFVPVRNFALMSYASATEPLRAVNLLAGSPLYEVVPLSVNAAPISCSAGFDLKCQDLAETGDTFHTIFVCAGGGPADWAGADSLYPHLRKLARQGVKIGAISGGAYMLAAAGLLDHHEFTIHWEYAALLRETFPNLTPRQTRFVIDGARITCGGGVAALDMMHALITDRMGADFARRVSDWYLHTAVGDSVDPQRGSSAERFGTHHRVLLSVLEKMETSIENPLSRDAMAKWAGLSTRHLNRLFLEHQDTTFSNAYRAIRLKHARRLVEQSALSVSQVAFATGFSNAAQFSNAFTAFFGLRPKDARNTAKTARSAEYALE
ncbi:GlxA family transcriptional regulator (plasmid) [Rhizobium sp. CB3090]|uniref:GlxA family transcriptional regulator n=1 Tax=Rhizobium sp. CB3090 TaxID=3039156 RepID=UPI0024B0A5EB|nr:GlxA family transcriptional regulator [Rhizobium sp. CB3090]WFU11824.1 GlxA family transcriptional regulator [Rhizobium sp. CB3090]